MSSERQRQSARRNPGNPGWKKGVSGNPGGRPKGWAAVRAAAQAAGPAAVRTLISIMNKTSENGAVRIAAATALLDRGFGRPETRTSADSIGAELHIAGIKVTFVVPDKDHLELDAADQIIAIDSSSVCEEAEPAPTHAAEPVVEHEHKVERLPVVFRNKPRGEW